ncbi:MAG: BTAD domain-containing putative transcriptional regulator [Armatimonadota bacterium]
MPNSAPLITKFLQPRRRDDVLTRRRLLERLYDMVDHRLALLAAPAGYGKTTLLVDFATDLAHPVCWYALDASDRDPRLFLERLVHSLRRQFPGFGEETLRALSAGQDLRGGAPGVVKVLINEVVTQIPRWFVLVLDDYHALGAAPEVDAILSGFVTHNRDQCLTVVASRTTPDLPHIISLVARGGVGGIGPVEMQFLPEEVQELFARNYGTTLNDGEAAALAEQAEGWITGLLLMASARLGGLLQRWMRASSSEEPVYEYLAQEVFSQEPPEMQRFLTVTSTLSEVNLPLCTELLRVADAAAHLEALERRNLFVTRLEDDWYRYHHLFRAFLQARLQKEDAPRWRELHLRAARWFEAHGQPTEAVDHYLAVEAFEEAARIMEAASRDLYVSGRFTTLMDWGDRLPKPVLTGAPRMALYEARAALKLYRLPEALALAETAERGYRALGQTRGVAYAKLQRCEVLLAQGELDAALALAQEALALIEASGVTVGCEAHRMLGRIYVRRGDLEEGYVHLKQALELSEVEGIDYDQALIRTGLAHCLERMGRLSEAVALQREAVVLWRRIGSDAGLTDELADLGYHLYALGEYEEAARCLQEALALARRTGLRAAEALVLTSLGELTRDLGLAEQAADHLREAHALARQTGDGFIELYTLDALALVLRSQEAWEEATSVAQRTVAQSRAQELTTYLARYLTTLGAIYAENGNPGLAREALDEAFAMLNRHGVTTELWRTRLVWAWAHFLASERSEALELLTTLLEAVPEDSVNLIFVCEGQHARALFEAARRALADDEAAVARLDGILAEIDGLGAVAARLFPQSGPERPEAQPSLRVYGFGPGRVEVGEEPVALTDWGSAAARHLLFYMLIHGARTREQIFADFFPELSTQKAKASFHTTKFRLNRALGFDAVEFDGQLYALHPDLNVWFDVMEFERHLRRWRQTQEIDELSGAVELYTDDFVTDCYDDWCEVERGALRARCLEALGTLAERLSARRQYRLAIRTLHRGLELEPARESFHQQLMRAYALSGQRSQALAQYKRCVAALEEHMDAPPSRETIELYHRVLAEAPLD